MNKKIIIPCGNMKIVAEIDDFNTPEIPPEITVYLMDEKNTITQDICLVRPHSDYNRKSGQFETDNDFIDCLVWGDSDDEDYTHKFVIGIHEENEEE